VAGRQQIFLYCLTKQRGRTAQKSRKTIKADQYYVDLIYDRLVSIRHSRNHGLSPPRRAQSPTAFQADVRRPKGCAAPIRVSADDTYQGLPLLAFGSGKVGNALAIAARVGHMCHVIATALGHAFPADLGMLLSFLGRFYGRCFAAFRFFVSLGDRTGIGGSDRTAMAVCMAVERDCRSLTDEASAARTSPRDRTLQETPAATGLSGDVAERLKAAVC
jgi:hypothetical protein